MSSVVSLPNKPEPQRSDVQKVAGAAPELAQALLEFWSNRQNGTIELHMSNGVIARVYATISKTYK
jgi:hypothetical protein